jgi:uncharacterized protein with ParB-like and HNH nuclease domain
MTLNVTGLAEKGFYANKAYYEKNVIGKNNFTKSIDSYKDYMSKRGSGEIDAMGRQLWMVVVMMEILNPELQKILVEAQFKLLHQQQQKYHNQKPLTQTLQL